MAQPQRGPVRSEVSDLRNIVDRLDLLMGATAEASADPGRELGGSAREEIEAALSELSHRIGVVERETEELRTLVNHLMTIATWQAKVTATLVGDEDGEQSRDDDHDGYAVADHDFVDRVGHHVEPRRQDEPDRMHRPAPTTLDDDIDDILGTDREPSSEVGPPPDFGI